MDAMFYGLLIVVALTCVLTLVGCGLTLAVFVWRNRLAFAISAIGLAVGTWLGGWAGGFVVAGSLLAAGWISATRVNGPNDDGGDQAP